MPSVARGQRDASMMDLYIFFREAGTATRSSELPLARSLDCSIIHRRVGKSWYLSTVAGILDEIKAVWFMPVEINSEIRVNKIYLKHDSFQPNVGEESMKVDICEGWRGSAIYRAAKVDGVNGAYRGSRQVSKRKKNQLEHSARKIWIENHSLDVDSVPTPEEHKYDAPGCLARPSTKL
ncbi:hypothetical protein EDD22DRAFT_1054086 [Suillus occidentalis]|nr:hypothetical protein EDD22DRAFT_1054086 [Suillus occidentalis]